MNVSWLNHRGGRCKTWIKISEQNNVHLVLKIIGVYNCCTLDVYISKHCKLELVWWMSRHCNDDAIMAALFCSLSFGWCLHNVWKHKRLRQMLILTSFQQWQPAVSPAHPEWIKLSKCWSMKHFYSYGSRFWMLRICFQTFAHKSDLYLKILLF